MVGVVARLLTGRGDEICRLERLQISGEAAEAAVPFCAIVTDSGVVLRKGLVTVETDDGSRYAGHVGNAEAFMGSAGPAVEITGVLLPID
jgi:hypothetical protein